MKRLLLSFLIAIALLLGGRTTSMTGGAGTTCAAGDIVILEFKRTDADYFFSKENDFEKVALVVDEMLENE